ncbi:MAG: class I SAM-dependent methyltransferase [Pseudohongiellaceae bacterium]
MAFKDHFSAHAQAYAQARPGYPAQLFEFLGSQCSSHETAWDCATGNGQAALSLAKIFDRVIASDGSAEQLQQAEAADNIEYRQVTAETPFLEAHSCDLVTVAQALHWFASDKFFDNVRSCLKPEGRFAAWCYGVQQICTPVDAVVATLYEEILGAYWPPERQLVENRYRDISFPFETSVIERFSLSLDWNLAQLCSYITSWSALQRYSRHNGTDPLQLVREALVAAWGDAEQVRRVNWPLTLILGRM